MVRMRTAFLAILAFFVSLAFTVNQRAGIGWTTFDGGFIDGLAPCGHGGWSRGEFPIEFDSGPGRPLEFGNRSLSPFGNPTSNVPYTINYYGETPSGFSLDMGDDETDNDTLLLKAYSGPNGTGQLLAQNTNILLSGGPYYKRLAVTAAGIRSIVFIGGSGNRPNSVFYDNVQTICPPNGTVYSNEYFFFSPFPDFTVFRPSTGHWYTIFWTMPPPPSPFYSFTHFGAPGDKPVSGDFNGDVTADRTVFRQGIWYTLLSGSNEFRTTQFGLPDDIPLSADFDNDGRTDIAVFRPSSGTWYWLQSSDGQFRSVQWGMQGDIPLPGNHDRDGRSDWVVFRPGSGYWYILKSSNLEFNAIHFGLGTDKPAPADYDGDGITDIAVFRAAAFGICCIARPGNSMPFNSAFLAIYRFPVITITVTNYQT